MPCGPERVNDIINALDSTPYGPVLRDGRRRHQVVFEAMATDRDPITREVGEQLLTGAATPRQLLQHATYQQFFTDSLAGAQDFDLDQLQANIASATADGRLTGDPHEDLHHDDELPPDRDKPESNDRR